MNISQSTKIQEKRKITQRDIQAVHQRCLYILRRRRAAFLAEPAHCTSAVSGDATALPVRSEYGDCAQPFS